MSAKEGVHILGEEGCLARPILGPVGEIADQLSSGAWWEEMEDPIEVRRRESLPGNSSPRRRWREGGVGEKRLIVLLVFGSQNWVGGWDEYLYLFKTQVLCGPMERELDMYVVGRTGLKYCFCHLLCMDLQQIR